MKNTIRKITVFAILLTMLIACDVCHLQVNAATWSGSGTSSSPYLISNESGLRQLATNVKNGSSYSGKYFKVTANIALTQTWTPIGTASVAFRGTFDGNGKTISAMTATGDYIGLFAYVGSGATIKNVTLTEISLTGDKYLAGVAAYVDAGSGSVTIENCSVSGTLRDDNDGNMNGYLGGIVGYANAEKGTITISQCKASGSNNCSDYSGGIIGYGKGVSKSLKIQYCTNNAYINVYDCGNNCGGIAGYLVSTELTGCMNFGNVAGNGYSEDNGTSWLGGICGSSSSATYIGCGNYGNVSTFFGAGIDPSQYGGPTIESCFNVGKITGSSDGYHSSLIYHGTSYNSYSGSDSSGATAHKLREYFGQTLGTDNYPVPLTSTNRVYMVMVVGEHTGTYYVNYGKTVSLPALSGCAAYFYGDAKFDTSTSITRDYTLAAKGYHNYKDGVCSWCGNEGVDYVDVGTCGEYVAWKLTADGVLTISGTGAMADYSTSAYAPWYSLRSQIQSVVIKEGVTDIGNYAFYNLTNLTSVSFANSVTEIGTSAFRSCSGLAALTFNTRLNTIGSEAFYGCTALNNISIPSNVAVLGSSAFRNCSGLNKITLNQGLTEIGSYALAGTGLTQVEIPASVRTIGNYAFSGCSGLTRVTFRGSAPEIASAAFNGDTVLCVTPVFDDSWSTVIQKNYGGTLTWVIGSGVCGTTANWVLTPDRVLTISGTGSMETGYPSYMNSEAPWKDILQYIETVVICDGITHISNGAFLNCTNLRSITIPDSVTGIGTQNENYISYRGYVFANCTSLKDITIPKNVTAIAYDAFYGCNSLTAIYVATGNTAFISTDGVLYDRYKDTLRCYPAGKSGTFTVPTSVNTIANYAFSHCTGLTAVDLSYVDTIDYRAFDNCTALTEVTIPSTVTYIGEYAFVDCSGLKKIVFEGDLPSYINTRAFYDVTADVEYPITNTTWTASAFKNYGGTLTWFGGSGACGTNLTWEVYYTGGKATLTISGTGAMEDYTASTIPWKDHLAAITTVEFSNGITHIGAYALYECATLTAVSFPDTVITIGNYAFAYCTKLWNVTWSSKLQTIGRDAFFNCSISSLTVPDSVVTIDRYAFYGCKSLKSIKCGNGLETIGYTCFANCTALETVDLGSSIKTLDQSAFNGCSKLTKMVIPASVESMGTYVFRNCTNLQYVEFLGNAPTFNSNAFADAAFRAYYLSSKSGWTSSKLSNYGGTVAWGALSQRGTCGTHAEWILDTNGKLFICGTGAMKAYASPEEAPWYSSRANIKKVIVGGAVTSIGSYAFSNCSNLNEVEMTVSAGIGANAFANCGDLRVVIFSKNGATINASAFTGTTCEMWYPSSASYWSSYANKHYGGTLTWRKTTNLGTGGSDIRWALDSTGTFVMLGSGAMSTYSSSYRPWYDIRTSIYSVIIGDEITKITTSAFSGCTNLKTVTIGSGVTQLESTIFSGCTALNTITFLGDPPSMYYNAFSSITATAYYPIKNTKWTSSVMQDKGGTITWVALCTAHEEVVLAAKAPTCTATGLTEGKSCSLCNEVLVAQEVIPAKGHFVTGPNGTSVPANTMQASCTQSLVCNVCRVVLEQAKGHRVIEKHSETVVPLTISNTASVPFVLENGTYYSNNHSSSSSSDLLITAQYACSLTLQMGVSSEQNYDKLIVLQNNIEKSVISGITSKTVTLSLAAGDKVIVRYKKDGSADKNEDRGWVTVVYENVTIETEVDVPANTAQPDCTNGVVCAYCQTVIKEALGHRVIIIDPIPDPSYEIINTSDVPFVLTDGKYYSNNHAGSSSSELKIVARCKGSLSLAYGVSSEDNYDKLTILLNGTEQVVISGVVSTSNKTFSMEAGDTLIVRYSKDSSVNKNDDQGWVQMWYTATVNKQIVQADTLEPDCTNGVVCSYCETVVKEALGHTEVVDAAVEATYTTTGLTEGKHCSVCEAVLVPQETIPYVVGAVDSWNVVVGSELTAGFAVSVNGYYADSANIVVEFDGEQTVYKVSEMTGVDGIYSIRVPVCAAQMNDAITVSVVSDGNMVTRQYSIVQYAKTLLEDESQSAYHQIVRDMLNYGAAAQTYFAYNTDNPANAGVEGFGTADVPEKAETEILRSGSVKGIRFYGASLLFYNRIAVRFYFTGVAEGHTFTVNGTACQAVQDGEQCYVELTDINPQDLAEVVSVCVDDVFTVSYSPMNYMVRMSVKGSDTLKVLVKALYNYHLSAKALV